MLEEFSGSSDQNMIVKGKRSKRARAASSDSSPTTSTSTEEDEDMANCLILLARGNSPQMKTTTPENKFSSRKFAGKVGIYVYECKTCNRTFPSFQALGGHRASHKKPKTPPPDDRQLQEDLAISPPPQNDPNKPKMHECSICGSEFGSGQALGGHMRRHRPPARIPDHHTTSHEKPSTNMLALDLNLPAPPEDEKLPPPHLVFSAAALVDCHY